jgi:hypothetical protein
LSAKRGILYNLLIQWAIKILEQGDFNDGSSVERQKTHAHCWHDHDTTVMNRESKDRKINLEINCAALTSIVNS